MDLVIYEKNESWGALSSFDESLIKARVTSDFYNLPFTIETFTISFGDISNNGASLNISWDNKIAIYVIDVLTKEKVLESIKNTMDNNPSVADYRKAAIYYYEENQSLSSTLLQSNLIASVRLLHSARYSAICLSNFVQISIKWTVSFTNIKREK